jgi:hypothetical protein
MQQVWKYVINYEMSPSIWVRICYESECIWSNNNESEYSICERMYVVQWVWICVKEYAMSPNVWERMYCIMIIKTVERVCNEPEFVSTNLKWVWVYMNEYVTSLIDIKWGWAYMQEYALSLSLYARILNESEFICTNINWFWVDMNEYESESELIWTNMNEPEFFWNESVCL